MPRFDGTGPAGMGAMTGWGMGPCATGESGNEGVPYGRGYAYPRGGRMWFGPRYGRGRGMGLGRGRGFGYAYSPFQDSAADLDDETIKANLTAERDALKNRLDAIEKRMGDL